MLNTGNMKGECIMALDGINSAKQTAGINAAETNTEQQERITAAGKKGMNSVYGDDIKPKTEKEGEISYAPKDPENKENTDKMSHDEASEWIRQYKKEHDCSRKEAKAAFEEKFGYECPMSGWAKTIRTILLNGTLPGLFYKAHHKNNE